MSSSEYDTAESNGRAERGQPYKQANRQTVNSLKVWLRSSYVGKDATGGSAATLSSEAVIYGAQRISMLHNASVSNVLRSYINSTIPRDKMFLVKAACTTIWASRAVIFPTPLFSMTMRSMMFTLPLSLYLSVCQPPIVYNHNSRQEMDH